MRKTLRLLAALFALAIVPQVHAQLSYSFTDGVMTISGTGTTVDYTEVDALLGRTFGTTDTSLTGIDFSGAPNLTTIGANCFFGCNSLVSVSIPATVNQIGDFAIYACDNLSSVTLLPTVPPTFGTYTLYQLSPNVRFYVPTESVAAYQSALATAMGDGFDSNSVQPIPSDAPALTYAFSNGTLTITGDGTTVTQPEIDALLGREFGDMDNTLTAVDFTGAPNITTLGYASLFGCEKLTSITIPATVTTLDMFVLYACTTLSSVTFQSTVPPVVGQYSLISNAANMKIYVPATSLTAYQAAFATIIDAANILPIGGSNVLTYALSEQGVLTITGGGESIDYEEIEKVLTRDFPLADNSVTAVDFTGAVNLKSIGNNSFFNFANITAVEIPATVNAIGSYVFYGCPKLKEVTLLSVTPPSMIEMGASFTSLASDVVFYVPAESLTAYRTGSFAKSFGDGFDVNCIKAIGDAGDRIVYSLDGTTGVLSVSGGGEEVVATEVDAVVVRDYMGAKITTVKTIDFSATTNLKKIGSSAFYYYESLSEISIPEGVTSIESMAFAKCGLKSVELPQSLSTIGAQSFNTCISLNKVTIPAAVTTIDVQAFSLCLNLKQVLVMGDVPATLGSDVFANTHNELVIYVPADKVEVYKTAWSQYASRIQAVGGSAVVNPSVNATVFVSNGVVVVEAEQAADYRVVSLTGAELVKGQLVNGRNEISVNPGVAIVMVGNKAYKVIVK